MSIYTYNQVPNNSANPQYVIMKDVLERAPAYVALDMACEKKMMDRQTGNAPNFRRWVNSPINLTSSTVTEGINPAARALQFQDYTGTLVRYAELFEVSRIAYDLHPYDAVVGSSDVCVTTIASDQERVRYNAAIGSTNVAYNSVAVTTRPGVNGPITLGRLQLAVRQIRSFKGKAFSPAIGGQNKEGTNPVEPAYYAFCSTDLEPDLRAIPGFKTVAEYPNGSGMHALEFGAIQNIRFFTNPEYVSFANAGAASTTMISTGATGVTSGNADVYPIIIMAQNFLTSVRLAGSGKSGFGNVKIQVLDQPDKSDPTGERIYISGSWYDLALVTAPEWGYRIEVAATRNPT